MSSVSMEQFDSYLAARNLSPNTIQSYDYSVKQFYTLYHRLTASNLRAYKLYLLEHHKPQTVNLRIQAMNAYLRYRESPISPVSLVRVQNKTFLDRIISQADYEYLMRRVYIPTRLKDSLLEWTGREKRQSGPLFLSRFGTPLTAGGIRVQLKSFAHCYGLNEEVMYPHSFRHRFAKNFIEKCGDIALLSDLLGHDSIETTRIYLRRSSTEQAAIVNRIVKW